jgi:hypothetical protein
LETLEGIGFFQSTHLSKVSVMPSPRCSPNLPSPKRFVQAGKFFGRRERLPSARLLEAGLRAGRFKAFQSHLSAY